MLKHRGKDSKKRGLGEKIVFPQGYRLTAPVVLKAFSFGDGSAFFFPKLCFYILGTVPNPISDLSPYATQTCPFPKQLPI